MKHLTFGGILLFILTTTACKKNNSYGYFTFKGNTYEVTTSGFAGSSLYTNQNSDTRLYCEFGLPGTKSYVNRTLPTARTPGYLTVQIAIDEAGTLYTSTGGNGSNQTVYTTSQSQNGITVQGSNIEMVNESDSSDSTTVTFQVTAYE